MNELLPLVKQSLSIVSTATAKDQEIKMLINAGIRDLERQGIVANTRNPLIQSSIIMFVKSTFGMVDLKEKEMAQKTYNLLCNNIGLSSDFIGDDDNV